MLSLLGAEMPDDSLAFVVINVVKRSAMNQPQKRPGLAQYFKNYNPAISRNVRSLS